MATDREELAIRLKIQAAQQSGDEREELNARMSLNGLLLQDDPLETDPLSLIPGQDSPAIQPQEPTTIGEDLIGAGETLLTLGTGVTGGTVGMAGGFLSGLAQELRKGNFGTTEAADRIEQAAMQGAEALTRAPRTRAGQEQVQAVGGVLQQAVPLAGLAGEISALSSVFTRRGPLRVGQQLIDDTGRPTKMLEKALDKKGLVFDNLTPEAKATIPKVADRKLLSGPLQSRAVSKGAGEQALIEQLKANSTDNALAEVKLVGGRVAADELGIQAVKQGFEPGFVTSVKASNPATRQGMDKILTIMQRVKGNTRLGLDMRPTNVTGDSFKKRIVFLRDKANKGRTELNRLARTELHGKAIDSDSVLNSLGRALDDLDIELIETETGKTIPSFARSIIKKNGPAKKAIKDAVDLVFEDLVGGDKTPDALAFHKMKRQFDDLIDFKKQSRQGLSEKGRNVLKTVRASLNDSIREVSKPYADVNDVMHKSLTALDDFQSAVGSKTDMFRESGGNAIGQEMRKLMSNYRARTPLDDSITLVENTVRELGGGFPDDVRGLAMFARTIEDRFGTINKTSLGGEVGSAVGRAVRQGPKETAFQAAGEVIGKGADKLMGINDLNAFRAMRELINR